MRKRSGNGSVSTHCRTGTSGITRSTSHAASAAGRAEAATLTAEADDAILPEVVLLYPVQKTKQQDGRQGQVGLHGRENVAERRKNISGLGVLGLCGILALMNARAYHLRGELELGGLERFLTRASPGICGHV